MNRVVITGIGSVTPLADTFPDSWAASCAGRSGVRGITRFDASLLPWRAAGEVSGSALHLCLDDREQRRLDPFARYAVVSAMEALASAGISPGSVVLENSGVVIGSSRGGISMLEHAWAALLDGTASPARRRRIAPSLMPATTISMAASAVAQKAGIRGSCLGISNACASGSIAVGEAYRMIRSGFPGPFIAGGTDAPVCRICIEGYGASGALSKKAGPSASRPFDRSRDGFVLSEGSCILVLEGMEAALRRSAPVLGEIVGYANASDAFHQTRPSADGEAHAIRTALASADTDPAGVDLLVAHGTSTIIGDRAEAAAIRAVFGEKSDRLPVTAVKSMTGHMLAGSSAFEIACAAMSLKQGVILPTINLQEQDASCGLHIVREKQEAEPKTAVVNSFGFGGVNSVLVLRRFRG